jgi:hypothetical protein
MSETECKNALLGRFDLAIESFAENRRRGYLLATAVLAVAGYGWLLIFPCLVLAGISSAHEAVTARPDIAWLRLLLWIAVAAGAALVTYRMARFKAALPTGVVLDRKKAPALFVLVNDLRQQYGAPWIDHVMISGEFELDIAKTPYCALPLWSTYTLVIGLPLVQSLSPTQFRCALARRLGQCSRHHNRMVNWVSQLRRIWPLYADGAETTEPGFGPVRWFFRFFAPFYSRVTLPAARLDELAADSCAMETCSDDEVLDTITTEAVCRLFVEEKYWPTYHKLTGRMRDVLPKPHAGMATVLRSGLQGEKFQEWLVKAVNREPRPGDAVPTLRQRVDNIGHRQPSPGGLGSESAATVYFGSVANAIDAALGLAEQTTAVPQNTVNAKTVEAGTLISALQRRFRRDGQDPQTAPACDHEHVTTLH